MVLSNSPILCVPGWNKPFKISTDASQNGIGTILYQEDETIKYISFFSKSLSKSQRNYSATKRELLAIVSALRHFKYFIYGQHFEIFTDHKALTFMFKAAELPYMLHSWIEEIMEFNFTVINNGIQLYGFNSSEQFFKF